MARFIATAPDDTGTGARTDGADGRVPLDLPARVPLVALAGRAGVARLAA